MKPLKVAISTVGCRANQADSAAIVRRLDAGRVALSSGFDGVDLAVINTCCVTAEAERDCRKLCRRVLAASPGATVVLAGCAVNAIEGFGQGIAPSVIKKGGPDAEPRALAAWINERAALHAETRGAPRRLDLFQGRTRALLKIQNGCTHGCAYCIVPRARGPERSLPAKSVLEEVARLAEEGFKEVVLTGVQLGAWGLDLEERPRLSDLVIQVADRFSPGRVRLSSIEPWSVDAALIAAVVGHDRICNHLHLPLQHGDDRILQAMGREYDAAQYRDMIDRIRQAVPDVAIGTDVLLGFPGESDEAFDNTLEVLEAIGPAYVHAFSYSPRPHTRASRLSGRPDGRVVRERTAKVRRLGAAWADAFRARHLGQLREVIVEENTRGGPRGLTDTFVKVLFTSDAPRPGDLVWAEVKSVRPDCLEVSLA